MRSLLYLTGRTPSPFPTEPEHEGIEALCEHHRLLSERDGLFELLYERIHANWVQNREPNRWPTSANWVLRVAPEFTPDASRRLEKQLQKQIAICLENEGWGNDVPTASGLVNSRSRHMNVDLAHRLADGFELLELKLTSNTPYDAALQILRYGAIYMLYRLEPELKSRFESHEMMRAERIVLEVLAPLRFYSRDTVDLPSLEKQLNREVSTFVQDRRVGISLSFRFRALPADFVFRPGMACEGIRDAILHRVSPFSNGALNQVFLLQP